MRTPPHGDRRRAVAFRRIPDMRGARARAISSIFLAMNSVRFEPFGGASLSHAPAPAAPRRRARRIEIDGLVGVGRSSINAPR